LAKIAEALGRSKDAEHYTTLSEKIKDDFNARFLDPKTGQYLTATQTCQAFGLFLDLVPSEYSQQVQEVLVRNIIENDAGHLTTGIFGTRFMLFALTQLGRTDLAYQLVNQKTFPSYGYMLENGATTLWETWAFSDDTYSHNHPMFGSVSEWFYKTLAGIQPAPDAVGFNQIIIKPKVVGDLTWVRGQYNSVRGKVVSEWKLAGDSLTLSVTIPTGTVAKVFVPALSPETVTESGNPAGDTEGVKFLQAEEDAAVYEISGGTYSFHSRI